MTFTLKVEGCPPMSGLTRKELHALIETARKFPGKTAFGGPRIDVTRDDDDRQTRYPSGR